MDLGIGGLGNATEIGAGASAIVYRARQLDLDREVAVKVLSLTDEAFVRRFAREAKMLGKLSQNPGIVTVYDTGVTGAGQPYLILELCESSVLDRLQGPEGAFDPISACQAGAQVADAVSDAHNNGVVHRDIKPGNILRSQTGRHMITDFGISTVTGATMGQTNSVGFTAGYVAPETLSGETAGTPADIYALGATLFHMIAGQPAFVDADRHSNLLALAQRVINDPVPDLRPQGVPDEVCRIIEGAMAKRPQDRPTAAQLRDQLSAVVADLDHLAPVANAAGFGAGPIDQPSAVAQTITSAPAAEPNPVADATTAMAATSFDSPAPPAAAPAQNPAPPAPTAQQGFGATEVNQTIASPGPGPSSGDAFAGQRSNQEGGILDGRPAVPAASMPQAAPAPYIYTDDKRSLLPLLVGALVGFLALLGAGAFLISQAGGDDDADSDDITIEAREGSDTSLNPNGNQSTGQDGGGARGTLDPSSPTTDTTATVPTEVEIPSVLGQAESVARTRLQALGFTVTSISQESTETPGTVIRQSPASGQSIPDDSTVSIFVAKAKAVGTVPVPDLSDKTLAEAEAALTEAGLTLATPVTREFHPTVPKGQVISSSPAANITVDVDSAVALVISDGIEPPACADLTDLTEAAATAQLEAANLTVTTTPVASTTITAGTVASCTQTETSAALVISAGDVCTAAIGTDVDAATTALEAQGFTVTSVGEASDTVPLDEVSACTPNQAAVTLTYAIAVPPPDDCSAAEGRKVAQAQTFLTGLGFVEIVVLLESSETIPAGEVITCTAIGTTANLTASSGPSTDVTVPDVVGRRRTAGLTVLRNAGLDPAPVVLVDSDAPAGEIVATRPAAGAVVALDSVVVVEVSNGTATETVAVPAIILGTTTQAQAEAALVAVGLVPDVVVAAIGDAGVVSKVTPGAGTIVEVGSTVTLTVGPEDDDGR
ncbi:MAG: PASTA domain-containing protein [Acidimicrobiales bacterium]